MRLKLHILGLAVCAATWGCKPPPLTESLTIFKRELRLHFNNLNADAQQRRDDLRKGLAMASYNPTLAAPTGTTYSTFQWEDGLFLVLNYKCRTCQTKLLLPTPANEYLCAACGHCPYVEHAVGFDRKKSPCDTCIKDGKPREPNPDLVTRERMATAEGASVKDMFELTQENTERPLRAKVRYIRRQMTFDARGTVSYGPKVYEKAQVEERWMPTGGGEMPVRRVGEPEPVNYQAAGFHRLDATYVGEIEFEYRAGAIREVSRAAEVAVRPWKDLKGNQ